NYDYFGGPCLPDWEASPPLWLPAHQHVYRGLLGWIELSAEPIDYDAFEGELCGGNMIVRRDKFLGLGGFAGSLGRGAANLMGGEDGELHRRLKRSGARGLYVPCLSILHKVPSSRMTIGYHRRWAYWSGV